MATTWQITGDLPEQYDFSGNGNPVVGHQISFMTGNQNRGSVFVPNDHYNIKSIRNLVHAQAVIADEVATLTSGS